MKELSEYVTQIFETDGTNIEWFGYYNYDPFDLTHTKLLCNRSKFDARAITAEDCIEVGFYDLASNQWKHIGSTSAFNWQQGAMLQWLPAHEDQVIYNCVKDGHYASCIHNIQTGEDRYLDAPIYGILPDGKHALTLNYERSYWCRAYHYKPIVNEAYHVNIAEDDGVFEVDLEQNTIRRIVSIADVIKVDADEDFSSKKHWLEHIMINPQGTKFVFLHRFSGEDVFSYKTRVVTCNIDGSNLQVVSGWRTNHWSHVGWINETDFTVFTVAAGAVAMRNTPGSNRGKLYTFAKTIYKKYVSRLLGKKVKKKLESGREYQVYRISEHTVEKIDTYSDSVGVIDGHPSFTQDEAYMITDTYPDAKGYQHLLAYCPQTRKCVELAKFYAPLKENPASCDLHPKLSRDNKTVVVDTAYTGEHRMTVMNLHWDKISKALEMSTEA